mgnify:CR=1 FL=1
MLRQKNRELKNIRALAQVMLNQRSEIEQFFLEALEQIKEEIRKNCTIQLVPPNNHRRNLAERAIQTFKNHFKAILAGVDDNFPMHLWDRLLPQTILTLNLLRQAHVTPTVSAYHYVHGPFDYNKMPLAPLGWDVQCSYTSHPIEDGYGPDTV